MSTVDETNASTELDILPDHVLDTVVHAIRTNPRRVGKLLSAGLTGTESWALVTFVASLTGSWESDHINFGYFPGEVPPGRSL